jgi:hypothetical protein
MKKVVLMYLVLTVLVPVAHASAPKNLGSAIRKINPAYVEKYLADGQTPAGYEGFGFGDPYFVIALDKVIDTQKDALRNADALHVRDLMIAYDTDMQGRNSALLYAAQGATAGMGYMIQKLIEIGADVNYFSCRNLGFGLGKKSPWTALDVAASTSGSSISEQMRAADAVKILLDNGAKSGRELGPVCENK